MYGKGSDNITVWLRNIACAGTEEYPDDCLHDRFGSCHGCTHEKDASIECKETKIHGM